MYRDVTTESFGNLVVCEGKHEWLHGRCGLLFCSLSRNGTRSKQTSGLSPDLRR